MLLLFLKIVEARLEWLFQWDQFLNGVYGSGSIGDWLGVFGCEWIRGRQMKHALEWDRLMIVELYAASW